MLIGCVIVYMVATVAVGLYAATRVHSAKDFMVAGRSLPLYMSFACVFATWFGAETVLSVSAKFAHKGLGFVSGDPFGASTCLVLVAFFFARTFYRMGLMTIGDYYHMRYGKFVAQSSDHNRRGDRNVLYAFWRHVVCCVDRRNTNCGDCGWFDYRGDIAGQ